MDKNHNITGPVAIPMGEHKIMYIPVKKEQETKYNTFLMLMKKDGTFDDLDLRTFDGDLLDIASPIAALHFKSKKSINDFIRMLRHFRNNHFGTTDTEEK